MEDSIFTKIINGEVPCHKIYEDERTIAFLTIQPFAPAHTLVVPKKQVDQIWDLDDDEYQNLMQVARKIGLHLRTVSGKDRVGMVVKGFDVPHVHVHLVPIHRGDGVSLDQNDLPLENDEVLAAIAQEYRLS
ncbi:MAG TPA: HIT family protein [Candidatus Saccharibacteria bacterium]|nr:HIT family protein [Candidatus Saccharibacteria bacterium]HMR38758.1 HIT family protein [Candidatus Saccharibacteria bacterium]